MHTTEQTEETAVALCEAPGALASDMLSYEDILASAGDRIERGGDVAIPFLAILQSNSPQTKETESKFIDGARPGMVLNTTTNEVYDTLVSPRNPTPAGLIVVSCGARKFYVEWVPRDNGGGFVGQHLPESAAVKSATLVDLGNKRKKLRTPEGNDLIETSYHHVVVLHGDGRIEWAVIGMSSTQLKASRRWNKLVQDQFIVGKDGKTIPGSAFGEYMIQYKLTTEAQDNAFGSWFGWNVAPAGVLSSRHAADAAKAYLKAVKAGTATISTPPAAEDNGGAADDGGEKPF